jgi:hypothetical protein
MDRRRMRKEVVGGNCWRFARFLRDEYRTKSGYVYTYIYSIYWIIGDPILIRMSAEFKIMKFKPFVISNDLKNITY